MLASSFRACPSFISPNLQVADREAKVATQRNVATYSEIFAIGASGAFVFFQLLGNFWIFVRLRFLVISFYLEWRREP